MVEIECESSGITHERRVIGKGSDYDEAREDAFNNDAHYSEEAAVWSCQQCVQEHYEEGMRYYGGQQNLPEPTGDPMTDYLTMKGEL